MIVAKYSKVQGHIVWAQIKGHAFSGSGEYDMVCAAVSAITQTALLGLKNVANADPKYQVRDGYLSIRIDGTKKDKLSETDTILYTMLEGLKDLAVGYPNYIRLEEEENVH